MVFRAIAHELDLGRRRLAVLGVARWDAEKYCQYKNANQPYACPHEEFPVLCLNFHNAERMSSAQKI
jgi:hypothetical protein